MCKAIISIKGTGCFSKFSLSPFCFSTTPRSFGAEISQTAFFKCGHHAELSKQRAKEKLKLKVGADLSAQSAQIEAQIHIAGARLKVVVDLKKRKKKRIT